MAGIVLACRPRLAVHPVLDSPATMLLPATALPVDLVAVVNSYNRLSLLREALGALTDAFRRAPGLGGAVVVYEAGSTDGSREFLAQWQRQHPDDRLEIVTPAPGDGTSFSHGVNAGASAGFRRFPDARFLLLYETDNWIAGPEPLFQAREVLAMRSDVAGAGWTVRFHAGGHKSFSMCFPTPLTLAAGSYLTQRLKLEDTRRDTPVQRTPGGAEWWQVDIAFTSPMLIRRAAWERTGGLDAEAFPFGGCDLDWAWRCRKLGLGVLAIVRSQAVVHDNRGQESAWSADRVFKLAEARLALVRRHRGAWRVDAVKPLLFLRHALESAALLPGRLRGRPDAAAKLALRLKMLRTVWRDYRV